MQDAERGLSVEALVEQLDEQAVNAEIKHQWVRLGPSPLTPEQAADDIRELRKGLTLGGLTIKDLISEGRKY